MKKRLKFQCCYCGQEYSMTREIEGKPQLIVVCPFCEKEAVVDLDPYRKRDTTVFRGDKPKSTNDAEGYDLPPVIPTSPPPQPV